jgi:hypothetical protein
MRKFLLPSFLFLAFWGNTPGTAQTQSNPQATPAATQSKAQPRDPKLTPVPGKMRGTTNEMRKAAAIRNADRKAKAQNKAVVNGGPVEVKQ